MLIETLRFASDDKTTLSTISVDGRFICFALEDRHRTGAKVPGATRIPAGDYAVRLRTVGGFHGRYSRKFADMHRGMLELVGVPNFEYVLIHIGNDEDDTAGCLLTGTSADSQPGNMSLGNSTGAYKRLYAAVVDAAAAGDLRISIKDGDQADV